MIAPRGDILDRNGERPGRQPDQPGAAARHRRNCPKTRPRNGRADASSAQLAHMSLRKVRRTIDEERRSRRRGAGDAAPRRRLRPRLLPGREPAPSSPASRCSGSSSATTRTAAAPPTCRQRRRGHRRRAEGSRATRTSNRATRSARAGSSTPTTSTCAATPGLTRIQVNALGQPTPGGQLVSEPPTPGDNLKLTIDPTVQAAGEAALASRGLPGAFVTMNIHNGEILGDGLLPDLRPDRLHPADDPGAGRTSSTATRCGAAHRPRDRRPLPDGLDLQDHHRPGGARKRRDHAARRRSTTTARSTVGGQSFQNAGGASYGPVDLVPALQVSSDVFFYKLGLRHVGHRRAAGLGAQAGDRPADRDRPARARPKAWCRASSGATSSTRKAKPNGPGRPATTSSWRSARATCRPTRCRWRSPTRRSATAARSSPRTSGMEVEDAAGRVLKEFDPRAAAHDRDRPRLPGGDHGRPARGGAGRPAAPRTAVFGGFPIRSRQDRHRRNAPPHADQSWYIVLAPYPNPRIVTIVTVEEGGFGAESAAPGRAADPRSVFRQAGRLGNGSRERRKRRTDVRDPRPTAPGPSPSPSASASASASASPTWTGRWRFAAVALVAFSVFTLGQATRTTSPAAPTTTSTARRSTASLGIVGMLLLDPDRLLALPRAAGRHLHLPLRQRLAGLRLRLRRARLAARLRTSLLQLPAIGARQAPARPGPCRASSSTAPGAARRGSARCATSASDWPRLRSSSCSRTSAPPWCSRSPPSP